MNALFINTRPHVRYELNDVSVLDLPLLTLSAFDKLSNHEQQQLHELIQGRFKVVIVVSKMAVACAINWLNKLGIHHASDLANLPTFIAVGQATATALSEFGVSAIVPETHAQNNEGMLDLPILQNLNAGGKALIWRGVDGRRLIDETLTAKGVDVSAIAFYERKANPNLPQQLSQHHQILNSPTPKIVLISSQASLDVWHDVCDEHLTHLTKNVIYLSLGERLTHLVRTYYPNHQVYTLADLSTKTIKQLITDVLTH